MTAAEQRPEPDRPDLVEPLATWLGDPVAAARFGSPEQIRAGLPAEQVPEFDAAFDAALTDARDTLRLDQLRHVLLMWRRQALLHHRDPAGHREMLAAAADIRRLGHPRPGSVTWSELQADLGH